MQPNLRHVSVVTLSLLSLLGFGMVYPDKNQVNTNARLSYDSGKKAQALLKNNQLSEIARLNKEAIEESRQGQSKEGLQKLQQALAISRDLGERSWEAVTLNNIGRIYQSQKKYSEALQSYQQALLINKELGDLVRLGETGLGGKLGNGEEILGFGYQMQQTGARAAIASLWSVDDGGTQALMSAFYGILSTEKLTKTEALRQAQVSLITGDWKSLNHNIPVAAVNDFSHPYYWAPFILIGNGL
ncbi:TPR repeat-containing protein [Nostoc sp. 'Lobaria pulmonaria (5183) cyanobiont']|nr:TPR repeat-containing protein [Nostoc sp. 'Lobaria pulmonaria (5183) cyanobiont']